MNRRKAHWLRPGPNPLEVPAGNATKDRDINKISIEEQRVVISKDAFFLFASAAGTVEASAD